MPTEHEIRAIVAQVLDGVLAADESAVGEASADDERSETAGLASIAVGADHGGFPLKEFLVFRLRERGHRVEDCGTESTESVDYPVFAEAVANRVASGACDVGLVVDGAGIGSAMAANKVPGIRAATCHDVSSARNSREHNHANVLSLGAGLIGKTLAWQIVEAWLDTPWAPGRHARRVEMIMDIERRHAGRSDGPGKADR
jgi:RpiB/LacA/LacB family sugar-phosphate isomerase